MAAVNSMQGVLRLPLTGLAPPRVLMCSASMGAEGSVTLQLREAVQSPDSGSSLDGSQTIGYPDSEILADMLGSIQASGNTDITTFDILDNRQPDVTNIIKTTSLQSTLDCDTVSSENGSEKRFNSSSNSNSNHSNSSNLIQHNSNSNNNSSSSSSTEHIVPAPNPSSVKKARPKTASPTRHGPQQCQVCSKVFGNASALAKHKLTHSDERKYVCGMCSKAFKRQDHLNGHMLTHRNKKPYECKAENCGKSYCDARSLRRHTENHHSSLAMTPTTPNQSIGSSTGPPTGLSLSPATASGDASSPHGATCIQYNGSDSSKPSSPSSPAGAGNEGLTRQQLDLISQIMQQTKQANASIAAAGQKQIQRPRTWNMQTQLQQTQTKVTVSTDTGHSMGLPNGTKMEQKPVECNLCHRKFKNVPALNGHMRLHGGYFKKDAETKKCDKRETPGPPLQTASVGIRALIEEKIISKRSKDLKGSFVVPAPPLAARRMSEADTFLTHKMPPTTSSINAATVSTASLSTIVTSCAGHTTTTITNISQLSNTTPATIQISPIQTNKVLSLPSAVTQIEGKDATLIELLKRGTRVAVKRTCSDPGQLIYNSSNLTTAMLLPSNSSLPTTPTSTPPLSISLTASNNNSTTTPLALTISQAPSDSGDVFTLAYSADTSTASFFGDNDVYNVPDTAMLLQAVDSIQLLHDSTATSQLDEIASLSDYTISENGDLNESAILTRYTPSRQLQAVLNSPLPESLAEFSTLHSKDFVLYGCNSSDSPNTQSSGSPLPSPLAYPTPPASHEAIAQTSPFLDDSHHFSDANSFFDDKKNVHFLEENSASFFKDTKDSELSDNERILKLKNELFNDTKSVMGEIVYFKAEPEDVYETKASNLLTERENQDRNIAEFNQNLSFLDEPQSFLDDARNTSSPLSAAFFTGTMSSAEEVKEALEEVLPNENVSCDNNNGNDIDLYYLPTLALQSQMMLNSDDPLLSSSPKDFVHKQQVNKFDFNIFSPPNTKKVKIEILDEDKKSVQTTDAATMSIKEIFLSPGSAVSSMFISSSPKGTGSSIQSTSFLRKRANQNTQKHIVYKSKLRKSFATHYTPSPILNPDRPATGLYSLIANNFLDDVIDFDFGDSACVPEFLEKSKVNIGSDFQAIIPNSSDYSITPFDQLMWDPKLVRNEKQVQRFVDLAKSSAVPLGCHSEETALQALLEAHGETHIAILALLQSSPTPLHKRWLQPEIESFLRGLEDFGKDFNKIANEIPSKTTSDCVQLYYFWKKLSVDYKTTHLNNNNEQFNDGHGSSMLQSHSHHDVRPHVCEMPDCSASFTSKAALHGHIRIHCIGRNNHLHHHPTNNTTVQSGTTHGFPSKDDYPCKVCGKVFNKVKSRSAHMKSHRPQETDTSTA